jgi:hypothetical protein
MHARISGFAALAFATVLIVGIVGAATVPGKPAKCWRKSSA